MPVWRRKRSTVSSIATYRSPCDSLLRKWSAARARPGNFRPRRCSSGRISSTSAASPLDRAVQHLQLQVQEIQALRQAVVQPCATSPRSCTTASCRAGRSGGGCPAPRPGAGPRFRAAAIRQARACAGCGNAANTSPAPRRARRCRGHAGEALALAVQVQAGRRVAEVLDHDHPGLAGGDAAITVIHAHAMLGLDQRVRQSDRHHQVELFVVRVERPDAAALGVELQHDAPQKPSHSASISLGWLRKAAMS